MKTRSPTVTSLEQTRRQALEQVRAIYREIDARPIQRNCTRLGECCRFRLTGKTPQLTRGEALVAAKAVRASGRKILPKNETGDCPLLKTDGRCMIYQDRPFGCRTHYCDAAGGPYARTEVVDLVRRLEAIDVQLQGDGPRGLSRALTTELAPL